MVVTAAVTAVPVLHVGMTDKNMHEIPRNPDIPEINDMPQELRQLLYSSQKLLEKFSSLNQQQQEILAVQFSSLVNLKDKRHNQNEYDLFEDLYKRQQSQNKKSMSASA
jgi:hypothetical protein